MTTAGYLAKKTNSRSGKNLPAPAKLKYFAVYAQAFPAEAIKRAIEIDYIRVTNTPVRLVK